MFLVASDVKNVSPDSLEVLAKSPSWYAMWKKHEYIHKFREGWRNKGLAQGSTISPILSVLPLAILDELAQYGLHYLGYADDGLIYGDVLGDYGVILQDLLDTGGVGAKVHPEKSKWVKKGGVWLSSLKFVGLLYDPFVNKLSACTRSGATLDLSIDVLALVDPEQPYVNP